MFYFIPSNVSALSRMTQFVALISYCVFADDSLKDIVTAIEMFPRFDRVTRDDKIYCMLFSCCLRFSQGVLASIVVLLLVIRTPDVIDIILNFAAVNFISGFDEIAFELARWGKYGPSLKAEADRIQDTKVPDCIYRKYDHVRYRYTIAMAATVLLILLTTVALAQKSTKIWVTQRLRVQFKDGSLFEDYSGCYEMDREIASRSHPWKNYDSFGANEASFGYCDKAAKWYLYEHKENRTAGYDACDYREIIASSARTYTYGEHSDETRAPEEARISVFFFPSSSSSSSSNR